ncbi:MAG: hypothetical protein Q9O74_00105 [Planctomycetota bacterium]|nr:hypothetical protein [Planctomycetota bacterium]
MTIQPRSNRQRGSRVIPRVLCAVTTVAVLGLASCKKEEPPPPPPPPPPPRIEQPKPLDAGSVLQSMDVDARVEFAEDAAPVSRDLAQAAIKLADAIARGDDETLRTMLDRTDHGSLDRLIASGQWYDATGKLEAVRVVSINTGARLDPAPEAAEIGLAVQDQDGAYVMLWAGRKVFDDWVFSAKPASDEVRARATAWDGVSSSMLVSSGPAAGFGSGLSPEILAQLQQLGIDPNNPDPAKLLEFLDQLEGVMPPEQLQTLRDMIESLGGDPAAPAADDNDDNDHSGDIPSRRPGG